VFGSAAVGFATVGGEAVVKRTLIAPDDIEFDAAECRSAFVERIEAVGAERLVPVLSAERLSGDMLYGAYDSVRLADRLAEAFPGAKVLIDLEQQDLLHVPAVRQGRRPARRPRLPDPASSHPASTSGGTNTTG
jgi:hypothetical protein